MQQNKAIVIKKNGLPADSVKRVKISPNVSLKCELSSGTGNRNIANIILRAKKAKAIIFGYFLNKKDEIIGKKLSLI
ncbi:hypothetical protein Q8W15_18810 [Photobacterium damselae subsp. piscicida]|uniref:hypothetical protein n=1 Tax=Photobacterium damselae TaxID=38293 RepID=UPI001FD7A197|nr:hypothetical protein [Photobacterium damselae]MDP2558775.1 hypothetical protein [Photobacterium damselae subsp. piscicida]MDP2569566.1 hypothetical protein [Photobacterium damselae subsp. piscicida]